MLDIYYPYGTRVAFWCSVSIDILSLKGQGLLLVLSFYRYIVPKGTEDIFGRIFLNVP